MAEAPSHDPMKDLFWFLGVLFILFLIWFATGGPQRPEDEPFVILEGQAGGRSRSELLALSENQAASSERRDIQSNIRGLEDEIEDLEDDVAQARLRGVASPFEDLVYITTSSRGEASLPQEEYLVLEVAFGNDVNLDITGWQLQSAVSGNYATIGSATELPLTGQINPQSSIVLPPGGRAIVTTGSSPIGTSFRVNKCTGYFEQFQNFNPPLSLSCPDPGDEFEETFRKDSVTALDTKEDGYEICQNSVWNIPRCSMYRKDLRDADPRLSSSCQSFIRSELSYQGCLNNHRYDSDFYSDEWRVYIGNRGELWRDKREIIRLLDREGRTVHVFTY